MQSAKLHLSPEQIKLVANADWILTKNEILQQIKTNLEILYKEQQTLIAQTNLPEEIIKPGGKISRGENYLGLPWIVLDYPRCFIKENIFAIRSMVWWGRFFSITLHLSGKWQQQFSLPLLKSLNELKNSNFLVNYQGDEWLHDVSSVHYVPLANFTQPSFKKILSNSGFVKIASFTDIKKINNSVEILSQQFHFLLNILSAKQAGI